MRITTKGIKPKLLNLKREMSKSDSFRVIIFGSARIKSGDIFYKQVYHLAKMIGARGYDLLTGGGPGMMEAANEGHVEGDVKHIAESIGLVIDLPFENKGNPYLEIKHRFRHFSKRLDTFLMLGDVMVVTKGGIGTLLETFYVWQHLQVHQIEYRPIIFIGKMWTHLIVWMKKELLNQELISPKDFDFIYIAHTDKQAIEMIDTFYRLKKKEKVLRKIKCKGSTCTIPRKPKKFKS